MKSIFSHIERRIWRQFGALMCCAFGLMACQIGASDEVSQTQSGADSLRKETLLRSFDHSGREVAADCLADDQEQLTEFVTPHALYLGVGVEAALGDIVVTCTYQGVDRTEILKSRPIGEQSGNAVNFSSDGNMIINDIGGNSGASSVEELVALGLSTNVVPSGYFVYPNLVRFQF